MKVSPQETGQRPRRRATFADIEKLEMLNKGGNEQKQMLEARKVALQKSNNRLDKLAHSTERQPGIRRLNQVITARTKKLSNKK